MKLVDAVSKNTHTLCGTRGQGYGRLRQLYGEKFYTTWDSIHGLFDVELLQLGRYALSIQNSETEKMVSRSTTILEKRKAQTSGFLIQFFPEKTERVEDTLSQELITTSSTPHLLHGQGGFKTFLKPVIPLPTTLTYTDDKAFHSHAARAMRRLMGAVLFDSCHDSREQRTDSTLICYGSPSQENGLA